MRSCLVTLVLLGMPAVARPQQAEDSQRPDLDRVVRLITRQTNEFRKAEGRRELARNDKLTDAARYFADFMARTGKYGHEADGKHPWDRAEKYGYHYCLVAENIAYIYSSEGFTAEELAGKLVDGWKKSPGHRKNMLDPDVFDIGVAVARSATTGRYYAVQEFGRPRSKAIVFKITNAADAAVSYTIDGKSHQIEPRYTITHTVCRPPALRFEWPGDAEPKKSAVLHPENGSLYTVRKDESGSFAVSAGSGKGTPAGR